MMMLVISSVGLLGNDNSKFLQWDLQRTWGCAIFFLRNYVVYIRDGLSMVYDHGVDIIIGENDSKRAVDMINNGCVHTHICYNVI